MAKNRKSGERRKRAPQVKTRARRPSAPVRVVRQWTAAPMTVPKSLIKMGIPDQQLFTSSATVSVKAQHGAELTNTLELLSNFFPRFGVMSTLYAAKTLVSMQVTFAPTAGLAHGGMLGVFMDPAYDTDPWIRTSAGWLTNYGSGTHRGSATLALSMPRQHTLNFELPNAAKLTNSSEADNFGEARIGLKWITYAYEDSSDMQQNVGNLIITAVVRYSGIKPIEPAAVTPTLCVAGERQ